MNSRPSNSEATKNGGPAKAKIVTFYRSGDVNYSGYRMAISQRNYRKFETLLDELTTKVALPKGARRVHTPGGVHSVASVDALEDGRSYVVTSSKKLQPLNLDEVHRRRMWKPAKRSAVPNGGVTQPKPNGVKRSPPQKQWPSPPAGKDRTPPNRGEAHLSGRGKPSSTPKKITVVRNGDPRNKHMVLLNRRTAQNFEDILQAVSEIFNLPVRKLCTSDGTKVESLQAIFNGPDLFVALPATEKFRPFDYMDNSHPRPTRPKPGSHIGHNDETDQPAKIKSSSGSH